MAHDDLRPDYTRQCEVCGASPVVPATGMCGPCTFGEASMADGGWWSEPKPSGVEADPATRAAALARLHEALPHTAAFMVHRSEWTHSDMDFQEVAGVRVDPPSYHGGIEWSVTVQFPATQDAEYLVVTTEPSLDVAVEGAIARFRQWTATNFASAEAEKPPRQAAPGAAERQRDGAERARDAS
jgi:hypothetical protein